MSRLIDADALIKDVLDLQNCYNGFSDTYDKACIIEVIDGQPTIAPKRGKWIEVENKWGGLEIRCSECEREIPRDGWGNAMWCNYCPNCGARMVTE